MITSALTEGVAFVGRLIDRRHLYARARQRATMLGRPLVLVGAPPGGRVRRHFVQHSCGDLPCVDPQGCIHCGAAPRRLESPGAIPCAPDSAVVLAQYVFERAGHPVIDPTGPQRVYDECLRVAGDPANVFVGRMQPWASLARIGGGAHWQIDSAPPDGPFRYHSVTRHRAIVRGRSPA